MAQVIVTNQEDLEALFTTMGFDIQEENNEKHAYFINDPAKVSYIKLLYNTTGSNAIPIIYHTSAGTDVNICQPQNISHNICIEYWNLYGGGIAFRCCVHNKNTLPEFNVSVEFSMFPTTDRTAFQVIYNSETNHAFTPWFDPQTGRVIRLGVANWNQQVSTTNCTQLTKIYDNNGGFIDAEVYLTTVCPPGGTAAMYYATIGEATYLINGMRQTNIDYCLGYSYRLADEE